MPFLTLTTCETRQSETRRHQLLRLLGGDAALLGQELDGLRLGLRPGLVQVLVEAHRDPGFRRLDAREVERLALDDFHRDVEFLVGGLDRGEIDLAIALGRRGNRRSTTTRPAHAPAHRAIVPATKSRMSILPAYSPGGTLE